MNENRSKHLTWRTVDRIILLAVLLLALWYAHLGYLDKPGERIRGSDSIGYYVYLPSIFMDGDLDLADDFRRLGGDDIFLFPAPGDRAGNPYSVGPALLWTPWFALGHIVATMTDYATDGYSAPYQFSVYWGTVLYVVIGLLLTVRLLRSFDMGPTPALIATLSLLFTTQLTYYLFPKSAASHGLSFTAVAAYILSARRRGLTWQTGLLGGLAALVRWQNILLVPIVAATVHVTAKDRRFDTDVLKAYVPFGLATILGILPQIVAWQLLYGRPFLVPQLEGFVDLTRLPALDVLFSFRHGLVTWHPWWLAAGIGIFVLGRGRKSSEGEPRTATKVGSTWALAIAAIFLLQLYMNGIVRDWWGSWSFGHRRFVNLLPLAAVGVVTLLEGHGERWRKPAVVVVTLLALWNQAFLFQYQHGLIPRSKAPTAAEFFGDKLNLRKVHHAQLAVNTAVQGFRRNEFEDFLRFAEEAHRTYPEFRNTLKVYSVASAVQERYAEARRSYEAWLTIEPYSKAAKWGLADIYLRTDRADEAREAIEDLGLTDPPALQALQSGQGTLLTPAFFDQYRKELDQIYTE